MRRSHSSGPPLEAEAARQWARTHFREAVIRAARVRTNPEEWQLALEASRILILPDEMMITNGARWAN